MTASNVESIAAELRRQATENPPKHPIDIDYNSITGVAHSYNERCPDPRLRFVMQSLVKHLHDFARHVDLTTDEWMRAIQFLTQTGQTCNDVRQEFILLSDVLGLSTLVDSLNHPKPKGATESTVLGPFFTTDAPDVVDGGSIVSEAKAEEGELLLVRGKVLDLDGNAVANATIETWETDATGHYDTQYDDRTVADCRGRITSQSDGSFQYGAILPVSYPIPGDGPVGSLLLRLGRHVYRPSHLHLWVQADGFDPLITALYPREDKFLQSDTVFGVKSSLVVDPVLVDDPSEARKHGFKRNSFWLIEYDLILCTLAQAKEEREQVKRVPTSQHNL
ncbi:intradiol ring-cleavage dioxygenase [Acaromyces ingoldii]|uniref:Intradiol ring-cleavage dioxygenase n=1 Tax=Acaromyces ingoldii TaxID=215250 RepID=A0A316YWX7_9BASI|nr:intradiol ring-cleavage dioxygenase [Acaromyces ingoldii]PWN92573.1 intradiol ring-cleavage dioxygenase [Acaromyces ingoldii]